MTTTHTIHLDGAAFPCRDSETVIAALERAAGFGAAAVGGRRVPVGCRQGGCGVCRVHVLDGRYRVGAQSRAHVSAEESGEGIALACRLIPETDLSLSPAPRARGKKTNDINNI